jgi:hypothetical protein
MDSKPCSTETYVHSEIPATKRHKRDEILNNNNNN